MTPYLQLDLNSFPIDPQLARRVPYALSRYYLALPLGQDNARGHPRVSVAMAYPDNAKARQALGRLLHAEVVPVFTPAESLQPVLEHIYCTEGQVRDVDGLVQGPDGQVQGPQGQGQGPAPTILAWCGQPEWETVVRTAAAVLGDALDAQVLTMAAPEFGLDEVLTLAAVDQDELVVMPLPDNPALSTVISRSAAPLFLVSGEPRAITRILVVLRGFASDERALDWLAPFAQKQQATVTLQPLTNGPGLDLNLYHRGSPAGEHLARCLQRLQTGGVPAKLKYRRGNVIQQVVDEVRRLPAGVREARDAEEPYDLLVLTAEAEGDFVSQVITAVTQHPAHRDCPIFVLKPPAECGIRSSECGIPLFDHEEDKSDEDLSAG